MAQRIKAPVKPEILIWARRSAGFSVSEAAEKIKVDKDRLERWEADIDAPTIGQLRKLSEVYKRPLATFYLQQVPRGLSDHS
jgi:transcriptional regulator with XRE-family HTH domain